MTDYEQLAETLLCTMDQMRHSPPEPVSATARGEMAVLRLLAYEGREMNAGEIASQLHMTTARAAAVFSSLERKGYVLRGQDPGDKRRVIVGLTDPGRDYCALRRREAKAHLAGLLAYLGEEDAGAYARLFGRLLAYDQIACGEVNQQE